MATLTEPLNIRPAVESQLVELTDDGVRRVRLWGFSIAIGSFLFGFDTGIISGALLFIKQEFELSAFEQSSVVSVLLLGAVVGALASGRVSDRIGRRRLLLILGVVFLVGIAIAAFAQGYWTMVAGRVVMGLGVGGVSATVPTYLGEMAPAQVRGRMLTLNQLLIVIGLLASYLVNWAFAESGNWRAMFWVGAIPSALLALAALRLPESPAWLIANGREDDARKMLDSVTKPGGADKVIDRYARERAERERLVAERGEDRRGMRALLAASVRPALVVGLTLAALQQLSGINTILYYAPTIMQQAGLSASNAIFYSVAIGVINVVATIVSIALVDRLGRRALLLLSLAGMAASIALLGVAFAADLRPLVMLTFMLLYIVSFAIGMGPVFWVLLGEIFPTAERAEGSSAGATMNWLANFVVSLVFLPLIAAVGQAATFWIFAVVCALGVAFVAKWVPETRRRNYDAIATDLRGRWSGAEAT